MSNYLELARKWAQIHQVPEDIAVNTLVAESSGKPDAISSKGAYGLMQLMPKTAAWLGVDPKVPEENIEGGVRYLKMLKNQFGTWEKAVAAYNFGEGNIRAGKPWPTETRKHVAKVLGGPAPDESPMTSSSVISEEEAYKPWSLSVSDPSGGEIPKERSFDVMKLLGPSEAQAATEMPTQVQAPDQPIQPVPEEEAILQKYQELTPDTPSPAIQARDEATGLVPWGDGGQLSVSDPADDLSPYPGGVSVTPPDQMPQARESGSWADIAKEWGPEIGILLASTLARKPIGGPVTKMLGKMGIKLAPWIAESLAQGAAYGTMREGMALIKGKPPEQGFITEKLGVPNNFATRIAEETAFFPVAEGVTRGVIQAGKGILKTSEKIYKPVGDAIWENAVVPVTKIPVPYTGKNIQELFQPAIERIRKDMPMVSKTFRRQKIDQTTAVKMGEWIGQEAKNLNPTERLELLSRIGKGYGASSPKVAQIMTEIDRGTQGFNKSYQGAFADEFKKVGESVLRDVDIADPAVQQIFQDITTAAKPMTFIQTQRALDKLIRSSGVPDRLKVLATDLYNIPAKTPSEVAHAAKSAMMATLEDKLLHYPGKVISSLKLPGYDLIQSGSLKGKFAPRDITLELDALEKIHKYSQGIYFKYFLSHWKTNKVLLRPAAHARNFIGNMVLNDWGGLPFYRVDVYAKGLNEMRKQGPLWREWLKQVGGDVTFSGNELNQLAKATAHGANMFEKMMHLHDRIAAPARGLFSANENWFKFSKYLHNRGRGLDPTEAAMDAIRWTFDYSEVTPFVAAARSHMLGWPFGTWQSKVLPLLAETAVKHPIRLGKWFLMFEGLKNHSLENIGMNDQEWEGMQKILPQYMQRGWWMPMPWRDEKGQLKMLNLTWLIPGLGDAHELLKGAVSSPMQTLVQSPVLSVATGLMAGKTSQGIPLWYEWEHPATKAAKASKFLWQAWSPAVAPGNVDWNTLWDAIQERPEALTPEEAVASQFGLRLSSVNPALAARRARAIQQIYETGAGLQMKRELRRAATPEERANIMNTFRETRQRLHGMEEE